MVLPESIRQLALPPTQRDELDNIARNISGGQFRLRKNDPDAEVKFTAFLQQQQQEFEAQQAPQPQPEPGGGPQFGGFPGSGILENVARGALGAGRFAGEQAQAQAQNFLPDFLRTPEGQAAAQQAAQRLAETPTGQLGGQGFRALDTASGTSAGLATEALLAPNLSSRGLANIGVNVGPNAFDAFQASLQAERQQGALKALLSNSRAFRGTEFAPGVAPAIEAISDVTNLTPIGPVNRALGLAGREALGAAGATARGVQGLGAAAGQAVPSGQQIASAVDRVSPVGTAQAFADEAAGAGGRSLGDFARAKTTIDYIPSFGDDERLFRKPLSELTDEELTDSLPWVESLTITGSPGRQRDGERMLRAIDQEAARRGYEAIPEGPRSALYRAGTNFREKVTEIVGGRARRVQPETAAEDVLPPDLQDLPPGVTAETRVFRGEEAFDPSGQVAGQAERMRTTAFADEAGEAAGRSADEVLPPAATQGQQDAAEMRRLVAGGMDPEMAQDQLLAARQRGGTPERVRDTAVDLRRTLGDVDDDIVQNKVEATQQTFAESTPIIEKITSLIRESGPARQLTEAEISAARRSGVATGRRRASRAGQEGAGALGRSRAFLSGQSGRRTNQAAFEPLAVTDEAGDLADLTPSESAQSLGLTGDDFNTLYTAIERAYPRVEFKRIDAQRGMNRLLLGNVPTRRQISLLEDVFGTDFAKAVLGKRGKLAQAGETAFDLLFLLPKTVRSSFDMSAPLRQAVPYTLNPFRVRETSEAMYDMIRVGFGKDAQRTADQLMTDITDPTRNRWASTLYEGDGAMHLHDVSGKASISWTDKDEVYASRLAEMMPQFGKDVRQIFGRQVATPLRFGISATTLPIRVLGRGVRRSELMYATYLNGMRNRIATRTLDNWDSARQHAVDIGDMEAAEALTLRQSDVQMLKNGINVFTGRGNLGSFQRASRVLAATFWSPRLLVSRFQAPLIAARGTVEGAAGLAARATGAGPETLLSRVANSPGARARKEMAKDFAAFVGTGMTILAAIRQFGIADVEIDPRSSDFGKGRFGNTRIDFWGGFQPPARYAAQLITGQTKTTTKGEVRKLGFYRGKDDRPDRAELLYKFLQSKVSPGAPAILLDQLRGETYIGESLEDRTALIGQDIGPTVSVEQQQAIQQLIPLFSLDLVEAIEEEGWGRGMAFSGAGSLGAGLQIFEGDDNPRADDGSSESSDGGATGNPLLDRFNRGGSSRSDDEDSTGNPLLDRFN